MDFKPLSIRPFMGAFLLNLAHSDNLSKGNPVSHIFSNPLVFLASSLPGGEDARWMLDNALELVSPAPYESNVDRGKVLFWKEFVARDGRPKKGALKRAALFGFFPAIRMLENSSPAVHFSEDPELKRVLEESGSIAYMWHLERHNGQPPTVPTPEKRRLVLDRAQKGFTHENVFLWEEAIKSENFAHAAFWHYVGMAWLLPTLRRDRPIRIFEDYTFEKGSPHAPVPRPNQIIQPREPNVEDLYQVGKCVFETWPFLKKYDIKMAQAGRCMAFYVAVNVEARKAIDAWSMVALRLGVVKDIRCLIGKMLWPDRHVWMRVAALPPDECKCRYWKYSCVREGCYAVSEARVCPEGCPEHGNPAPTRCIVCNGGALPLPAEAA